MVKTIVGIAFTLALELVLGTGLAHADPPTPVQCKVVNGTNVCRFPDGSVQACNPLFGCQPVYMQLAPGFWDRL